MKVKTWIPLVLAVVMGLAAAKLISDSLSRNRGPVEDAKVVATVTAGRDIEPGQKLTVGDLTTGKVAADAVPVGSEAEPSKLIGRVAITRIVKGQTVLDGQLAPEGTAAGVQALIPPGFRAVTLQVDEFSGLGGLLIPGCKVDIIAVVRNGGGDATNMARTIVQNVEVRAVGRQVSAASVQATATAAADAPPGAPAMPIPTNVTLLVTPEQAEAIQLASVGSKPWLVLRNTTDTEPFNSEGTSMADLRGDKEAKTTPIEKEPTKLAVDPFAPGEKSAPTPTPATSKTRTVKFIRATKEEAMQVDLPPAPPGDFLTATDPSPAK
jgi:pilus assembly protein CpaB